MLQPIIATTRDYVILKIPWTILAREMGNEKGEERKLILAGLKDIEEGRVSKTFKSAKSAITFLRSL